MKVDILNPLDHETGLCAELEACCTRGTSLPGKRGK
jgi:hypothetical protein